MVILRLLITIPSVIFCVKMLNDFSGIDAKFCCLLLLLTPIVVSSIECVLPQDFAIQSN